MKKRRKKKVREQAAEVVSTQRERFTVERFLHGIGDPMLKESLVMSLASGYQLEAKRVPYQVVPCVLMLACYARNYEDVELVDDYEDLVRAHREAISEVGLCAHPDLYLASCIAILHGRDQVPSYEGFVDIKLDRIYRELINVEE